MPLTLQQVIDAANELADENINSETMTGFVNNAIAEINIKAKAKYPFMSHTNMSEEFPLPDEWVRTLIIPHVVAQIKMQDSSQFEYMDQMARFEENLGHFITSYAIPDEYIDWEKRGYIKVTDPETREKIWARRTSDVFTVPPAPWIMW